MTISDQNKASSRIYLPELISDRLLLRRMTPADAADVQRLAGDRAVAATTSLIPHPYPDGAAEQWIASQAEDLEKGAGAVWAIIRREDEAFIGAIGLNINIECNHAELGYWIGVPYWNKGYVTEACRLVLDYAFNQRGLHRVQAHHFASNTASGRVMQKLGMTCEGTLRQHFRKWGEYVDCVYYGILRDEYLASNPGSG
jgi:[ribosomal protein S5]-alanine N-acetyltransferase